MAAATENTTRYVDYWGRTAAEITDVTWTTGDTFTSEFASVLSATFTPTTNASFGMTISGKTVSLVSGGSLTGKLRVLADNS